MSRWCQLLLCCLLPALNTNAAIQAVVAHSAFSQPQKTGTPAILELAWEANPVTLHFKRNDKGLLNAGMEVQVVLSNDTGVFYQTSYHYEVPPFFDSVGSLPIRDLLHLPLTGQHVTIHLELNQADGNNRFTYQDSLTYNEPADMPWFSTIQLQDTSFASTEKTSWLKNGRQQVPRALPFYDEGQHLLHYYTELYHSDRDAIARPLIQHIFISRKKGEVTVKPLERRDTIAPGIQQEIAGTFDISSLPSGNYYLNIQLSDNSRQVVAKEALFFQCLNKNPTEPDVAETRTDTATAKPVAADANGMAGTFIDVSKTFVEKYHGPQRRAILQMLLPQADPDEANSIASLLKSGDERYSGYFIYNFFSKRDRLHPEEAWDKYAAEVKEVNRMFTAGKPGYLTDRGIRWLKYGKPAERVLVPNESGAAPYEIWRYESLPFQSTPGILLFYQPGVIAGDYKVLTSTIRGELQNANWRSQLYASGRSSGNTNSRAEEYLPDNR